MLLLQRLSSHLRFRVALYWRLAIEFLLTVAGVVLVLFGGHALPDIVGGIVTGISGYLFCRDMRERWRRRQSTRVVENEDFSAQLLSCTLPEGYRLEFGGVTVAFSETMPRSEISSSVAGTNHSLASVSVKESCPYITNGTVNRLLDSSSNRLVVDSTTYEVPELLKEHSGRCVNLRRPDFNGLKVGLRTDLTPYLLENCHETKVQRTEYFKGVITNEMACEQFDSAKPTRHGRPLRLFAVADMVISGGMLVGLDGSELSNHIGVSTLVLSVDDQIVIQDQGDQCISGNETGCGASGSVDHEDIAAVGTQGETLQSLLRHAMEREADEELSARFANPGTNTILTGYARYLARGGKPEFFAISRSASALSEMKPKRNERKYVSGIWGRPFVPTAAGLIREIETLLEEGTTRRRRYSLSMMVCLRMARDYLKSINVPAKDQLALGCEAKALEILRLKTTEDAKT